MADSQNETPSSRVTAGNHENSLPCLQRAWANLRRGYANLNEFIADVDDGTWQREVAQRLLEQQEENERRGR